MQAVEVISIFSYYEPENFSHVVITFETKNFLSSTVIIIIFVDLVCDKISANANDTPESADDEHASLLTVFAKE